MINGRALLRASVTLFASIVAGFIGLIGGYLLIRIWLAAPTDRAMWLTLRTFGEPYNASLYYDLGIEYTSAGNDTVAFDYYDQALALPADSEVRFISHINRGVLRARHGIVHGAVQDYEAAKSLFPMNYKSYFNLGSLYLRRGDFDSAAATYTDAINVIPLDDSATRAAALASRGHAHYCMTRYDSASLDIANSLQLDPTNACAQYGFTMINKVRSMAPTSESTWR